ncbi:putative cofD-like protein [Hydrogenivirga caldilitoris]|uniref:Putative gluconeogenesis factor n=1 Tax=Hydrogenivirga caldilitoris TaxID=246264 RepID=A0A497XX22_9AQUI|nr:YvcK family protein [Hydrogenivirga caldilitoris]RLJ71313.1 putative cofD-like protein [Hydrogenivirga caldilitoris]
MKAVAIGGGTGLSTLLKGLKREVGETIDELSAIVTVADSGGSTGRLRKIYNIPAPGDIRNCIVALSESEDIMQSLFQYRFRGDGLGGHAFGNLFLTALTDITGSFLEAVKLTSQILRTKGNIIPSTIEDVHLVARFSDGTVVEGEEEITEYGKKGVAKIEEIWIEPESAKAPIEAIAAIEKANIILFGPGSLYTSIIPNLLIKDIRKAVNRSPALKVLIVNAMTQPGETDEFTAYDHMKTFLKFTGLKGIDAVIVNTKMPSGDILKRYLEQGQEPVTPDIAKIAREGVKVFAEDLIGDKDNFVRHDPDRLTDLIVKIVRNEVFSEL